jgi:hypothetical protein
LRSEIRKIAAAEKEAAKARADKNPPPNPLPFCPPERKSFCFCRAKRGNQSSQSGFSSKKVRISSNKHHHIELVASLGASPLASAGISARKYQGFLKSISSRPAARRRFTNEICIARMAMSRFFSFTEGERQSKVLLNCRCKALPFSNIIKE